MHVWVVVRVAWLVVESLTIHGEGGGKLLDSRLAAGRTYHNRGVSVDRLGHISGQTGW